MSLKPEIVQRALIMAALAVEYPIALRVAAEFVRLGITAEEWMRLTQDTYLVTVQKKHLAVPEHIRGNIIHYLRHYEREGQFSEGKLAEIPSVSA